MQCIGEYLECIVLYGGTSNGEPCIEQIDIIYLYGLFFMALWHQDL